MGIAFSCFSGKSSLTQVAYQTNKNNLNHQQPEKLNESLLSVRQESQDSSPLIPTKRHAQLIEIKDIVEFELTETHMPEALLEADAPQFDPAYQSLLKKGDKQEQAESQPQNKKSTVAVRTVFDTKVSSEDNNLPCNENNSIKSEQTFFTFKTKYEQHLKAIKNIKNELENTDCTSNKWHELQDQQKMIEQQSLKYKQFKGFVQSASLYASAIQNKLESCSDILDKQYYSRQETVEITESLPIFEDYNESGKSPHGHASNTTQQFKSSLTLIPSEALHNTSGAA